MIKLTFLRNIKENVGHFILITFWDNLEVIKNFASEDFEKAKYYPDDENFSLGFEEEVIHYQVYAEKQLIYNTAYIYSSS